MTNRLFVLLALFSLVFAGCPAPDEEGDNFGFEGTVTFTSSGQIRKIDLKTGLISIVGDGHSPFVTSSGEVLAALPGVGLVQYSSNGSHRTTLVASTDDLSAPQLSPFGDRIAYASRGNVYIINAATLALVDSITNAMRPQWLNDHTILLQRSNELLSFDLHIRSVTRIALLDNGRDAAVSPDRTKIAFVEGKDLFVMNADGTSLKLIMSGHTELRYPAWSQNSERIVVKDGCDLKLFKVAGGMVQSFRGHFFSFTDAQCPDASQLSWQ
jgi:hypothetical protein